MENVTQIVHLVMLILLLINADLHVVMVDLVIQSQKNVF